MTENRIRRKCYHPGLILLMVTVLPFSAWGQNRPGTRSNTNLPMAEVLSVSPSVDSRVLISALHGGGYPSPAQQALYSAGAAGSTTASTSADALIRITATVKGAKGQLVYFEVVDPDDPLALEDSDPDTTWSDGALAADPTIARTHNITLAGTATLAGNDNRDSDKNGRMAYNIFQDKCFTNRNVPLGSAGTVLLPDKTWSVTTVLKVTKQFAGDNYKVNATGIKPNGTHFFADQPKLAGKYLTSGLLTAWKRIYFEVDKMYQAGSYLQADAPAGQREVTVEDIEPFNVGTKVRIFDTTGGQTILYTVVGIAGDTVTLDGDLVATVVKDAYGFLGVDTGDEATTYYIPDTTGFSATFDACFVEFLTLPDGGTGVALDNLANDDVSDIISASWFKNKTKANYIHLVGAATSGNVDYRGMTKSTMNWSFILLKSIKLSDTYPSDTQKKAVGRNTVNHELVHQFASGTEGELEHDHERGHDDLDQCIMDTPHSVWDDEKYPIGLSEPFWVDDNPKTRPMYHLYKVRDWEDGI